MADLEIKNLHAEIDASEAELPRISRSARDGKEILKGVNLSVSKGEVVAIMGPNGTGKSTLAYAIMGHPKYNITKGKILFQGKDITKLKTDKRAKLGMFLGFQQPHSVSGISVFNFLRTAVNSAKGHVPVLEFQKNLQANMESLKMPQEFSQRNLNEGFSGGEKKRTEILQLVVLKPKIAILDEPDSGLDIDALKIVSGEINKLVSGGMGVVLITHYARILDYVKPDKVHVMIGGKIAKSGGPELAQEIEESGYKIFDKNA